MMEKRIDLHVHSYISDGSCSPVEIISLAKSKGLSAVALTDHESVEGNAEAAREAQKQGVAFVPGIEITVEDQGRKLHIVGLGFDQSHPAFVRLYKKIRSIKEGRMDEVVEGIRRKNIDISVEKLQPYVVTGRIDRYAIMRYLVSLSLYDHVQPLWDHYINPVVLDLGLDYNVTAEEVFAAVKAAGGITSLAHFHKKLGLGGLTRAQQETAIARLRAMGMDAMEQVYPNYTEDDRVFVRAMREKYQLMATGGTDFHGENRPGVELGSGIDNNTEIPYAYYQQLCR